MNFISVCSGIEAASVAWNPIGWKAVGFSEIEPFPSAVLAHHYPDVKNYGDMTRWKEWGIERGTIDLICGGTPCQSFSVAGLRKGLDDPRGNLMLVFLSILDAVRPKWVVWENVPGVLSSNEGRDFGAFLGGLGQLGYGWAYRVLDAQHVRVDGFERAVPQRRRRVFVVGCLGDQASAAAVLFERDCVSGNPAPSREAGKGFAVDVGNCLRARGNDPHKEDSGNYVTQAHRMTAFGEYETDGTASAMKARDYKDAPDLISCAEVSPCMTAGGAPFERTGNERTECEAIVAIRTDQTNGQAVGVGIGGSDVGYSLRATPSHSGDKGDGGLNCSLAVAIRTAQTGSNGCGIGEDGAAYTLDQANGQAVGCFKGGQGAKAGSIGYDESVSPTLGAADSGSNRTPTLMQLMSVRRLTPVECERLMGFPDNYTAIPWRGKPAEFCPDGPRYKALGNSWAVNCARWVGTRIQMVEELTGMRSEL